MIWTAACDGSHYLNWFSREYLLVNRILNKMAIVYEQKASYGEDVGRCIISGSFMYRYVMVQWELPGGDFPGELRSKPPAWVYPDRFYDQPCVTPWCYM